MQQDSIGPVKDQGVGIGGFIVINGARKVFAGPQGDRTNKRRGIVGDKYVGTCPVPVENGVIVAARRATGTPVGGDTPVTEAAALCPRVVSGREAGREGEQSGHGEQQGTGDTKEVPGITVCEGFSSDSHIRILRIWIYQGAGD